MKKILFFLIFCFGVQAQNTSWSLELNYPLLVDQNFVGANFNGLLEVGAKYQFWENVSLKTGVSLHSALYSDKQGVQDPITDFDLLIWAIQPRVYGELFLPTLPKFHPMLGLGYSAVTFFTNGNVMTFFPQGNETRFGFNAVFGFSLDMGKQWYFHTYYDFIKLNNSDNFNSPYLQNINQIKFGVGYRL